MPGGRQTVCRLRFIYFPHHDLYTWRDMSVSLHEQSDGSIILVIICLLEGVCLYLRVGILHHMCVVCECTCVYLYTRVHVVLVSSYSIATHVYVCLNT